MHPNLSFEQAPPLSVPFRFFLAAPWFGVAAGLLLAVTGAELFVSRWMPSALAATHLLTAGLLLQAMCGALLQFVPVAAGGNVWRPRLIAGFVHPVLLVSAALLAAAFLTQRPALFLAAAHGFAAGLGILLWVVGHALWCTPAQGPTVVTLRFAVGGLAVTAVLGIVLAAGLARGADLPVLALTDVHAAWGLGGWALMLLAGVSYFVVPMFQLTPPYPRWFSRAFPWCLLALLLAWSAQLAGYAEPLRVTVLLAGTGLAAGYGAMTLHLQSRRRRKLGDATLRFFRTAMGCLLVLPCALAFFLAWPEIGADPRATVWIGVLVMVGVFVSAISGMLYKIVPFLGWLHLQRACGLLAVPPSMNQLMVERSVRGQFIAHLLALSLLLAAVWLPDLARVAGIAFLLACAWLGGNLLWGVRAYAQFKSRIPAAAPVA